MAIGWMSSISIWTLSPGMTISTPSGRCAEPVTSEEKAFLRQRSGFAVRATGTIFGHTLETQFPLGLALAALSLSRGALFPPNASSSSP